MSRSPAICFYGDDLTGSTDALSNYARFGLSVRLVFDVASIARAVGGVDVDVLGVAGTSRSLPTEELEAALLPVFRAFFELRPKLVQYKVCSTFDSSPGIGSIGRVCELAAEVFGELAVPVLAAQPDLGRWTVFSNHFARGFDGEIYRLDRHPTMSSHPVTPMQEADLRLVLARQGSLPVRGLYLHQLDEYPRVVESHRGPLVLDGATNEDLRAVGRLIRTHSGQGPRFCVGSGGLSYALASAFGGDEVAPAAVGPVGPVLAVSGSCSHDTAAQIAAAEQAGWQSVDLIELGAERAAELAQAAIAGGQSAVVYSARGSASTPAAASTLGEALGEVARSVLANSPFRRLIVAGGDTSGAVMRVIGGDGLEYLGSIGGICAVCRLRASEEALDGLQVVLKGGQIGGVGFFEQVRGGQS